MGSYTYNHRQQPLGAGEDPDAFKTVFHRDLIQPLVDKGRADFEANVGQIVSDHHFDAFDPEDPANLERVAEINDARIVRGLMHASTGRQSLFRHMQRELDPAARSSFEHALKAFYDVATALERPGSVSLRSFADHAPFVAALEKDDALNEGLLRALSAAGLIGPKPEVHWVVDRDADEYWKRTGIDARAFMRDFPGGVLFEPGPGSGRFREEIAPIAAKNGYTHVSLCDKVYYSLHVLLKRIVSFESLEQEIGLPLTDEEKNVFCDALSKILMIQTGKIGEDTLSYDQEYEKIMSRGVDGIAIILRKKAHLLNETDVVPQVISTRDAQGNVIYPYKINLPKTPAFQATVDAFGSKPQKYLRADGSHLRQLPAKPGLNIFGDFSEVDRLEDGEIDLCMAVRSFVYVRGEAYEKLLGTMVKKLAPGGIFVDDGFRDNDGWRYRFAEFLHALPSLPADVHASIVLGPPYPGEDYKQTGLVPHSIVLTKDASKIDWVQSQLPEGFELVDAKSLSHDKAFLKSLDATGAVADDVDVALAA